MISQIEGARLRREWHISELQRLIEADDARQGEFVSAAAAPLPPGGGDSETTPSKATPPPSSATPSSSKAVRRAMDLLCYKCIFADGADVMPTCVLPIRMPIVLVSWVLTALCCMWCNAATKRKYSQERRRLGIPLTPVEEAEEAAAAAAAGDEGGAGEDADEVADDGGAGDGSAGDADEGANGRKRRQRRQPKK